MTNIPYTTQKRVSFEEVVFGTSDANPKDFAVVSVMGDCLKPSVKDGDTLVVDTTREPESSEIVVMQIEGEPIALAKRYFKHPDGEIQLACEYPEVKFWNITNKPHKVLGVVVRILANPVKLSL